MIFGFKEVKAAGAPALGSSEPISFLTNMKRLHHLTSLFNFGSEGRSQSWKKLLPERKPQHHVCQKDMQKSALNQSKSAKFLFETWKNQIFPTPKNQTNEHTTPFAPQNPTKNRNKVCRPMARCQTQLQDFKGETTSLQLDYSTGCKAGPHIPLFTCKSHQK